MDEDELDRLLGVVSIPNDNRRTRRAKKRAERESELAARQALNTDTRPEDSSSSVETKVDHRHTVHYKNKEPSVIEKDFAPVSATPLASADRTSQTPSLWSRNLQVATSLTPETVSGHQQASSSSHVPREQSVHVPYNNLIEPSQPSQPSENSSSHPPSRDDLAHRMLQMMLQSLSVSHASPQIVGSGIAGDSSTAKPGLEAGPIEIKQEIEPTASTMDKVTQVEEPSLADIKPPKDYYVVAVKTRLPGSRRRRIGYKVIRLATEGYTADVEEGMETDATLPEQKPIVEAPTPAQRSLQSTFPHDTLSQIEAMAQADNTHGSHLPNLFRDVFTTLSDHSRTVDIANHLRHQLDLPPLSTRTKRVALHRTIAKMRLDLYTELVSALVLPLAPLPLPCTDDEEEREKVEKITLTPSSLNYLAGVLPDAYPKEKYSIKRFMADPDAPYGEKKGRVEWTAGIGQMIGGDPYGPGFRGKASSENDGLVGVFVDYSNVLFGLVNHLRRRKTGPLPAQNLPRRHDQIVSLPVMSLLLRRGRYTPHGSLHLVASSPLFQSFDPLVRLGWEVSILKRVEILENEVVDSHASRMVPKAYQQDSLALQGNIQGLGRYKEQGVDEILHLKILQMLNTRSTPAPEGSTIVLATGDAKGGQFNRDGFLGAVREAIKRGWMVELWSFSEGLSSTWKEVRRKEKWDTNLTIRTFDQWADYMVEVGEPHF